MKLTVGPLPPAVYWRRRAIVLGGIALIVLLIVYSCDAVTHGDSGRRAAAGAPSSPATLTPGAPESAHGSLAPDGTGPGGNGAGGNGGGGTGPGGNAPAGNGPGVAEPSAGPCADADIDLKATIASTSARTTKLQYGGTFLLKLVISNASDLSCTRDVGSVDEELVVERASTIIWTSDGCHSPGGTTHDVRTFHPGDTIVAQVEWSSYDVTRPTCRRLSKPAPVGTYQLFGRLGTLISSPTNFDIVR